MGGQLDELLADGSPLRTIFALCFIQCMVTNECDSIKSNYWNRPEQSGFRLC